MWEQVHIMQCGQKYSSPVWGQGVRNCVPCSPLLRGHAGPGKSGPLHCVKSVELPERPLDARGHLSLTADLISSGGFAWYDY